MKQETRAAILAAVTKYAKTAGAVVITDDMTLDQLGVDSLDRIEVGFDIERELNIEVDDETWSGETTVKQIIDEIEAGLPVAA